MCVEILYNHSSDPEKRYIAHIACITAKEWRAEITALMKDIEDERNGKNSDEGEDSGPDKDRTERIRAALQKVNYVYPYIRTKRDVTAKNLERMINDPKTKAMLKNGDQIIECADLHTFASKIKPYIDSNNAAGDGDENVTLWPLVKSVTLHVKSTILEDGLCLVDLPGNHDTNAARSGVAAKFRKELNMCCVVAGAKRASDEKNVSHFV